MKHSVAAMTLKAPNMPLTIERDQCLTFPQLVSATSAGTRVSMSAFSTGAITERCGGLANWDTNASVTQRLTWNNTRFAEINEIRNGFRGVIINLRTSDLP